MPGNMVKGGVLLEGDVEIQQSGRMVLSSTQLTDILLCSCQEVYTLLSS